jgi:hypothetical protein
VFAVACVVATIATWLSDLLLNLRDWQLVVVSGLGTGVNWCAVGAITFRNVDTVILRRLLNSWYARERTGLRPPDSDMAATA